MTEKETAREHRRVASPKEERADTKGKEKVKERQDNVSTKSQNHQKSSGQVGLGNNGQNNLGMMRQTLRVGGMMIVDGTGKANGNREQKSQLSTTFDGGHRDVGLWSMGFVLDHNGKVSVLIRKQWKRLSSRRHLVDGI